MRLKFRKIYLALKDIAKLKKRRIALLSTPPLRPEADSFAFWSYSKHQQFSYFKVKGYDVQLYGAPVDPLDCNLKEYQDLLTYAFIIENIPKGAKILDIGGGDSRILHHFREDYECWNLDKLEGIGNGPVEVEANKNIKLVRNYIGEFDEQLSDNYFDFIFSISVLEHISQTDQRLHLNIIEDISRLLKPGGIVLHSLDCVKHKTSIWTNPVLKYLYQHADPISGFIEFDELLRDPDLYLMSEGFYNKSWKYTTKKSYEDFGAPLSYNFCSVKPLGATAS